MSVMRKLAVRTASVRALPIFGLTLASLIGGIGLAGSAEATTLPTGGQVTAGSATIGAAQGSSLTVDQTSSRAIIDWTSFSIGQAGSVRFNNGDGATLNRVTGGSVSEIDGLLSASGSVFVINPSGVIVGKSGVIDVGGSFVASTLPVSASNFMSGGDLSFSGSSPALVVNEGKIGALGGDVALIAATVRNDGEIDAANGTAGLVAGYRVVMRDRSLDDGKFAVVLGGSATSATNTGVIAAANAELRANGGNVYALAGNTQGIIKATGVTAQDGKVFLVAEGGSLDVAGTVAARGPGASGGFIETSGANVSLGQAHIDAGPGGAWLIDPVDLTVDAANAATIQNSLNVGTSVTLQTTASTSSGPGVANPAGAGDINIISPISWSAAGATLTLDAYHSVNVDAKLSVSGANSGVVFKTNDGGAGGALTFGFGSSLSYAQAAGQSVSINGQAYKLEYSEAQLVTDLNANLAGSFALANSVAFSTAYVAAPFATSASPFSGAFTGLGNTISGLNIAATAGYAGLFANLSGSVSNLGLSASISDSCAGCLYVGGIAGFSSGTITHVSVAGSIAAAAGADVGGVAGLAQNGSPFGIFNSRSSANVSGSSNVGGVAGDSRASLTADSSSGSITGAASSSSIGGLVGLNEYQIAQSYSTSAVTAGSGASAVGGLVGENAATGSIATSQAGGSVSAPSGTNVGGFVGDNFGAVANSFSTDGVTSSSGAAVGGFVGAQESGAGIQFTYATGAVSAASGTNVGAFAGTASTTSINNSIYDTTITGVLASVGNGTFEPGLVGETTAMMQDPSAEATNFAGWDFSNTWSAPAAGFFPELFGVSHILVLSVSNASMTYGNSPQSVFPVTAAGLQGGDPAAALTGLTFNTTATNTSNVGNYPVTITGSTATGPSGAYRIISETGGSLTIVPRPVTVSLTGATIAKTYDGTNSATVSSSNFLITNIVNGDAVSATASATYSQIDVGLNLGVTLGNVALTGAKAGNYTIASGPAPTSNNGEIDARQVTIALVGTVSKPYDGTTTATLSAANYLLSNIVPGDSVTLNDPTGGTYATANAGSGIVVSVPGASLALSGGKAFDYTLGSYAANGVSGPIGIITQAGVIASLVGPVEKTYDGTTTATLTAANYSLTGVPNGITLNDPTTGTYENADAGTNKNVTVTGLVLVGAGASNFVLSTPTLTAPVGIIDPKSVSASLNGIIEKTYDSTTNATLGSHYLISGLIAGDAVGLSASGGTYATRNAGSNINVSFTVKLSGSKAFDYTLGATTLSGPDGKIDPRPITASLSGVVQKTYDGTTTATLATSNYVFGNVVSSDLGSLHLTASSGAYNTKDAGTSKLVTFSGLSLTGAAAIDYTLITPSLSGAIGTILAKPITASLTGTIQKTYDGTTTARLGGNYLLTGVIPADAGLVGLTAASGAYATAAIGTGKFVRFTGLSLSGADAADYLLTTTNLYGYNGVIVAP